MEKNIVYDQKGRVKEYGATSRASVRINSGTPSNGGKDNFFTFEVNATMYIPDSVDPESVNLEEEFKSLFEVLNNQVDDQIQEVEQANS